MKNNLNESTYIFWIIMLQSRAIKVALMSPGNIITQMSKGVKDVGDDNWALFYTFSSEVCQFYSEHLILKPTHIRSFSVGVSKSTKNRSPHSFFIIFSCYFQFNFHVSMHIPEHSPYSEILLLVVKTVYL